jgi:hypothetical protein
MEMTTRWHHVAKLRFVAPVRRDNVNASSYVNARQNKPFVINHRPCRLATKLRKSSELISCAVQHETALKR